jgi:hypothetical protein
MKIEGGTGSTRRKSAPAPFFPSQTSHTLTLDWTRAALMAYVDVQFHAFIHDARIKVCSISNQSFHGASKAKSRNIVCNKHTSDNWHFRTKYLYKASSFHWYVLKTVTSSVLLLCSVGSVHSVAIEFLSINCCKMIMNDDSDSFLQFFIPYSSRSVWLSSC